MNDEGSKGGTSSEPWAAFQKAWVDAATRLVQLGFSGAGEAVPPEVLRQMRSGILQALAESWDQFLRSPQFLEGMKQWMEQAITFRQATHDFFTRVRHETEGTARGDLDQVVLAVQHMENRLLGRLEELASRVEGLQARLDAGTGVPPAAAPGGSGGPVTPKVPSRRRRRKTPGRRKAP